MKNVSVIAATFLCLLALTACGGGGGGAPGNGTTLSGVASKGIIRDGLIRVYALNADGSKGDLLRETRTDGGGAYRAELGSYRGAVLVEASGSYTDEATGAPASIAADAPLRAALESLSGEVALAVTPLTELAVQLGESPDTGRMSVASLAANNALIAALFHVDIIKNMPADALADSTATREQKEHALVLAAFARMMQSEGKNLHDLLAELKGAIGSDRKLAVPVAVRFQSCLAYFAQCAANRTGITDITGTPLINIGGSTRGLIFSVGGTASLIAGLEAVVILPPGVTVKADSDGIVPPALLQTVGGAAGRALASVSFHPASVSQRAWVKVALLSTTGFAAGDFLSLQCDLAPDAAPSDFGVSALGGFDQSKVPLTTLTLDARLAP